MATILERITKLFRASKPGDLDYYDDEAEPSPAPQAPVATGRGAVEAPEQPAPLQPVRAEAVPAAPQPELSLQPIETPKIDIPYWLEDEDTLRDEGVLFGLSESEPTEKTDIIHNYFAHLAADHERAIEQQNERVQELNLFIGQKENRIEELTGKLKQLEENRPDGEHNLPRTLVGLALSIAMCVGNYYLIEETLRPNFATSSFIALGVFLAGMFNLFGGISLFHDADSSVTRRRLLEEVGMPFAAALFVLAQAWQHQVWWQAVSLFVFVFFLFLFAGKLFLSNITVLRQDLRVWLGRQREQREANGHTDSWEEEIKQLRGEIDELRVQKWQVLKQQGEAETECDRLYARRDMLIKLFESEFSLARRMKGRLSERQLREIRGQ
ncbi:hypothetical protein [Telluribacter sp.]|jgi:hypothetical protein|uniref:hypothetical protein n=1 Tax=Telluribacter sp. TaxID=1978767 RepID=UPI002E0D969B|nr:hypothetical protein [Telluribacter sp.]